MPLMSEGDRLRGLAAMARALGRSESLRRTVEIAAEEARRVLDAAAVSLRRHDTDSHLMRTLVNVGDLARGEQRWPEDELHGPATDSSSLSAPVVVDGHPWGELVARRRSDELPFEESETSYLEALTAILAAAISRCLREESLEQLAYQDPLTGLANRRALDERAARAFDVPAGVRRPVTVVAIDINRLKAVNDTLGHVAGDQLISSVAAALSSAFDPIPGSLVARVGGDEFVVLVPGHDAGEVVALTDDLCGRTWQFGTGAAVSCGAASLVVTAGCATAPGDLFAAADRAQYVAKRARLSTTVVSDQVSPLTVGQAG